MTTKQRALFWTESLVLKNILLGQLVKLEEGVRLRW